MFISLDQIIKQYSLDFSHFRKYEIEIIKIFNGVNDTKITFDEFGILHNIKGIFHIAHRKYSNAVPYFMASMEKNNPSAFYNYGRLCVIIKLECPLKYFHKAHELNISNASNWCGVYYYNKQQYDIAIPYFVKAVTNDNYDNLYELACSYEQIKYTNAALLTLKLCCTHKNVKGILRLAQISKEDEYYQKAIELNSSDAMIEYGDILLSRSKNIMENRTHIVELYTNAIKLGNNIGIDRLLTYFGPHELEEYLLMNNLINEKTDPIIDHLKNLRFKMLFN